MHPQTHLLGFDIRERQFGLADAWSTERQEIFLLRRDIEKPFSTDVLVWPQPDPISEHDLPDSARDPFSVWPALSDVRRDVLAMGATLQPPHSIIAITLVTHLLRPVEESLWEPWGVEPKFTLKEEWEFLGYDVSDLSLLSGLSNCGYDSSEMHLRRAEWGAHLNEYHLFTDVRRAQAFKALSDQRVPEHAPFFLYGLYQVAYHQDGDDLYAWCLNP